MKVKSVLYRCLVLFSVAVLTSCEEEEGEVYQVEITLPVEGGIYKVSSNSFDDHYHSGRISRLYIEGKIPPDDEVQILYEPTQSIEGEKGEVKEIVFSPEVNGIYKIRRGITRYYSQIGDGIPHEESKLVGKWIRSNPQACISKAGNKINYQFNKDGTGNLLVVLCPNQICNQDEYRLPFTWKDRENEFQLFYSNVVFYQCSNNNSMINDGDQLPYVVSGNSIKIGSREYKKQ